MGHRDLAGLLTYLMYLLRHVHFAELFDRSATVSVTPQHFTLRECGPSLSLSFWDHPSTLFAPSQGLYMGLKSYNLRQCYHYQ